MCNRSHSNTLNWHLKNQPKVCKDTMKALLCHLCVAPHDFSVDLSKDPAAHNLTVNLYDSATCKPPTDDQKICTHKLQQPPAGPCLPACPMLRHESHLLHLASARVCWAVCCCCSRSQSWVEAGSCSTRPPGQAKVACTKHRSDDSMCDLEVEGSQVEASDGLGVWVLVSQDPGSDHGWSPYVCLPHVTVNMCAAFITFPLHCLKSLNSQQKLLLVTAGR